MSDREGNGRVVDVIEEVWRDNQMMGGALRPADLMAASALHALDHHVDRLDAVGDAPRRSAPPADAPVDGWGRLRVITVLWEDR